MSISSNFSLLINPKWKNTDVHDSISKIQFRLIFDETLGLLDFKTNLTGYCYIKINPDPFQQNQAKSAEYRKQLAKLHNSYPNLSIQALVDYSNKELFYLIQEFAVVELKIQVIPVESLVELAQYLERSFLAECLEDKNPFSKQLMLSNDLHKSNDILLNSIKMIPKIGDKNAQVLVKTYFNLKNLSNATFIDLSKHVGSNCARSVYDFFHTTQ